MCSARRSRRRLAPVTLGRARLGRHDRPGAGGGGTDVRVRKPASRHARSAARRAGRPVRAAGRRGRARAHAARREGPSHRRRTAVLGARVEECAQPRVEGVTVTARTGTARLHGKCDQARTVPIPAPARAALLVYLAECGRTDETLRLGQRGPLTISGATRVLLAVGEDAGVADLRRHRLRYTYGTRLRRDGADPAQVRYRLGHAGSNRRPPFPGQPTRGHRAGLQGLCRHPPRPHPASTGANPIHVDANGINNDDGTERHDRPQESRRLDNLVIPEGRAGCGFFPFKRRPSGAGGGIARPARHAALPHPPQGSGLAELEPRPKASRGCAPTARLST
ncbi:tyrosine-type recombinase/integrase [Actinomadura sp. WMMA1423]|uniref:tyrosine-type recombinase/integrase n=1 Tax=Actinomadura sp. WMMA1423 TaxID=2591108 RepID=UPI0034A3FA86